MTRKRRDDEVLTDDTDEYEVWERKRDGHAETTDEPDRHEPPGVQARSEDEDAMWLDAPPAPQQAAPEAATEPRARPTSEPSPEPADPTPEPAFASLLPEVPDTDDHDVTATAGATAAPPMGDDTDDAPIVLDDLPDPPREPMRVPSQGRTPSTFGRLVGRSSTAPNRPQSPSIPSSPSPTPVPRGTPMRIAIVATEFNYDITSMMLERAKAHAEFLGAEVSHILRVPGVYDLPLAVKRLARRDDVDAIVTLGCVIEGETDHDDLVIQHAARKIIDLSLDSDKPIGLGITGPGMSRMQAMARIDRAKEAVEAVVRLHHDLASV